MGFGQGHNSAWDAKKQRQRQSGAATGVEMERSCQRKLGAAERYPHGDCLAREKAWVPFYGPAKAYGLVQSHEIINSKLQLLRAGKRLSK